MDSKIVNENLKFDPDCDHIINSINNYTETINILLKRNSILDSKILNENIVDFKDS